MTHSRTWLPSAAVFALLFGIELPDPNFTGEHFPLPKDQMVAGAGSDVQEGLPQVKAEDQSARRAL
jgi:hypothetical protein